MKKNTEENLQADPYAQHIWNTNSRTNSEGALLDMAENILDAHRVNGGPNSVAHSITGTLMVSC